MDFLCQVVGMSIEELLRRLYSDANSRDLMACIRVIRD